MNKQSNPEQTEDRGGNSPAEASGHREGEGRDLQGEERGTCPGEGPARCTGAGGGESGPGAGDTKKTSLV